MKNFKALAILTAAVALTIAPAALGQSSDTATATANATIIQAITLTANTTLEFGDIVQDATGGTVTVDTAGTATPSGPTHLGGESAAEFGVTFDSSKTYAVTLPADGDVALAGPGTDMAVSSFTSSCATGCSGATFTVGATLTVGANQAAGAYTSTFDVTVAYE